MLKELLLLALAALCVSSAMHVPGKTADMDFLHKQKKIYELLFYIKQNALMDAEFYEIGRNYDIENNMDMYKDKSVVQEFMHMYRQGMLSPNAVYSMYYEEHRYEMKILFKLFYNAKDFQTFYKTAAWARLHLNDGVFTNALTIAVFQRPDCKYMKLLAPYEIYPNLYFDNSIIQQAHDYKMKRASTVNMDNIDRHMIYANYSGYHAKENFDDEYKLDYFMEDISLNSFYYYVRQIMPFWLDSKELDVKDFDYPKDFRGNFYYFVHKQLLNRYYLERMSNDMNEIEDFDWNKSSYPDYYSNLMYNNGIAMPQRSRYMNVPSNKYKLLKDITALDMRITSAIDFGHVFDKNGKQFSIYSPDGLSILGNIIEGNVDSWHPRFYGMYDALARDILGFNINYKDKNKMIPSALQCYSTSMRDPAFYRLYKTIMMYFFRYQKYLPHYTQKELIFPGVKFESVNTDKLVTYFGYCDTIISNAVSVDSMKEGIQLRVKARRYCLNHKPFVYRFNVNSDKETKAILKIFIGPASDEARGEKDMSYFHKYYKYFMEMDKFVVMLRQGTNTIERRSSDSIYTTPDMMSAETYYTKLEKAISGSEPFTYYKQIFSFPDRLILPKGKPEGMRFKMFFFLTPYDETKNINVELPIFGKLMLEGKPLDFPLDRPMYPGKFFTPNMYLKDVFVYHMSENENTKTTY